MEDSFSGDEDYYYSDRDSLDGLENDEADLQWVPPKGSSTKVITRESLLAAQKEDLRRVMELLSLREHHARTLLIHYRWDVEKLLAVLVENGKESLFNEAGVTVIDDADPMLPLSSTVMCDICMEEVAGWTEHFIVKINEGQSKRIRCMAHKCNAICDEAVVRNLVSKKHPNLAEKFERFLLESFIEDNKMVKWCPSTPHCGNAIRVEEVEVCENVLVVHNFVLVAYQKLTHLVHVRCGIFGPRNAGMNLKQLIGSLFIQSLVRNVTNLWRRMVAVTFWLCGGATGRDHTWSRIAGHSCGRYKEDKAKKTERAKRELYRYMHYHNRYKAHTDSFKLESKLKETVLEKVSISEERESRLRDFSWVTNGLYRLFRSRRVLSYSYPFAFYMFGEELFKDEMTDEEREIKQHLFEDQQQQLEANVEKLSKFLEEPFDQYPDDKVMEIRMQVINLSVITDTLCKKMYECIENDLLGCLQLGTHNIARYQSKGIERASELSTCWTSVNTTTDKRQRSDADTSGGTLEHDRPSGSRSSDDSGCSSQKRRFGFYFIERSFPHFGFCD
ncbi:hypothetical protein CUMW_137740 [Citrus unshiu]|uniref:Uncharacterized protein n=1 Tax=Citrus unshiu TaxID=55188 RepID=A0A2H5PHP8_CITUN|nr:hypothetical protein CUMW_137740 [Citrus unshiu]